jgi:hypothetical protein
VTLKDTPTLPSRTAQEHLCSPDGGCAKLFHSVTKLDSCAYRARARNALLYRPSSGLMGGPNYRGLAVARKAGAAVRESRFLRGLCTGATWAFKHMSYIHSAKKVFAARGVR